MVREDLHEKIMFMLKIEGQEGISHAKCCFGSWREGKTVSRKNNIGKGTGIWPAF